MIRHPRSIVPLALFSVVLLAGCGGGGHSNDDKMPYTLTSATAVLGQNGFTTSTANKGGAIDASTVSQPQAGTTTTNGMFFLADSANSRILGYNTTPTVSNTPANFVLGQTSTTTGLSGATSATTLARPGSAWVGDDNGVYKLVVADFGNNRVLIWNTVPTANTPPDVVVGQVDFTSSASGTTASTLAAPVAAAIARNHLFVVDTGNNRVLIWNTVPTTNGQPADIVLGQPDFTTQTTLTTPSQARMSSPSSVWTDGFTLLVADTGYNRVLYYQTIPSSSTTLPNFVIGQSQFTFSSTAVSSQTMNAPTGVSSDGSRIFVADSRNNRALVFNSLPVSSGVPADEVLGQENFTRVTANDDNGDSSDPQDGTAETAPTGRTLSNPRSVTYVGSNIFVSDFGNNRVLIFSGVNIPVPGNS